VNNSLLLEAPDGKSWGSHGEVRVFVLSVVFRFFCSGGEVIVILGQLSMLSWVPHLLLLVVMVVPLLLLALLLLGLTVQFDPPQHELLPENHVSTSHHGSIERSHGPILSELQ
jgi:hypothetical protein